VTSRPALAVGVDLGTSSVKVVAVDESGRCVARARAGYPTSQPEDGAAEQDPADWLTACDIAIGKVAAATIQARQYITDASFVAPAQGGGGSLAATIGSKDLVAVTVNFDAARARSRCRCRAVRSASCYSSYSAASSCMA
jgi:hypothetical protein